jgi:hypothetical protein
MKACLQYKVQSQGSPSKCNCVYILEFSLRGYHITYFGLNGHHNVYNIAYQIYCSVVILVFCILRVMQNAYKFHKGHPPTFV